MTSRRARRRRWHRVHLEEGFAVHLYELALEVGETSRDMVVRAKGLGLGHLTSTSVLTPEQIRALCPGRTAPVASGGAPMVDVSAATGGGHGAPPPAKPTPAAPVAAEPPTAPPGSASRRPSRALIAIGGLVALVALAGGAVTFLGTGGDEPSSGGAATTETTIVDDGGGGGGEAFTKITDPPGPQGPVAGTRFEEPVRILDVEALCAAWPGVIEYITEHGERLAEATDDRTAQDVVLWADDAHRGPAAGITRITGAYGVDGSSDEAKRVQSWILATHTSARDWDLRTMRAGSAFLLADVAPLQAAYDEAC